MLNSHKLLYLHIQLLVIVFSMNGQLGSFPNKVTGINTNTLVIPDVRSSDDNTYTCVARNEGGRVSSHIAQLTVTGI